MSINMKNTKIETISVEEMMQMSLQEIRDYHDVVSDNATSAWHVKRIKEEMERNGT